MGTQTLIRFAVCNSRSLFDCETNKFSRDDIVGYSDQINFYGHIYRLTNKRYIRDNRLIPLDSPHIKKSLAPRCRLIATQD